MGPLVSLVISISNAIMTVIKTLTIIRKMQNSLNGKQYILAFYTD